MSHHSVPGRAAATATLATPLRTAVLAHIS